MLLKNINANELIHCSERSFIGRQLIIQTQLSFRSTIIQIQTENCMNMFWNICSFDFNFCLGYSTKMSKHSPNGVVLKSYKVVCEEGEIKKLFFSI